MPKRKITFSLIVDQVLVFTSNPNMVREVKNFVSKFQTNSLTMFYVTEYSCFRSILSLNSKQFHKKIY